MPNNAVTKVPHDATSTWWRAADPAPPRSKTFTFASPDTPPRTTAYAAVFGVAAIRLFRWE